MFAAGSASASDVGAQQLIEFGPAPTVTLPPEGGGPFTDSLADVEVPEAGTVGALDVSTEGALGPAGFAVASARATDMDAAEIAADVLASECEATPEGVTGSSTIVGLSFDGEPVDVPEDPDPNTVLTDAEIPNLGSGVTITLNEQELVEGDDGERLVVTAMRVVAEEGDQLARGELYVSRSECGVSLVTPAPPAPVPAPVTFAG